MIIDIFCDIVYNEGHHQTGSAGDIRNKLETRCVHGGEQKFHEDSRAISFDSWLVLRGLKTLHVRMERQQESALKIANWLTGQSHVTHVFYVGLPNHPGYETNRSQARGTGSMISFRVDSPEIVRRVLKNVRLITFAESLGGVESLITYPITQTHPDVPTQVRERLGITDTLLRLSVGLEHVDDLIADLAQALEETI